MRTFLLAAAMVLAVSASPVKEERDGLPVVYDWKNGEKCPATKFYNDCNYCFCLADGRSAACNFADCPPHNKVQTRKAAPSLPRIDNFDEVQKCTPGQSFHNNCNSCVCSADGKSAACTKIACVPVNELRIDGYVSGKKCPAGKSFYNRCNACKCGADGHSAVCTKAACPNFE